jgi:hypothetical protein
MDSFDRIQSIAYELEAEGSSFLAASAASKSAPSTAPIQEFKISYPFEPSLSKERCSLCKLYFNSDTVNYKVPIRRMMELKKSWDSKSESNYEGRRYNFPSYLYTTTSVCLFCSQFFSTLPNERHASPPKVDIDVLQRRTPGPKLAITTSIERTDIAQGQKAYQSSEVDYKFAHYANSPPYDCMTRTKREVDPWWEIDFARKYNLMSLSFSILIGIRQKIEVYVFLMDRPVGFDDPFLDNIIGRGFRSHRVVFKGKDQPTVETVSWDIPPGAGCSAVRIQLKGIQVLSLQKFRAYQGNEVYLGEDGVDIYHGQQSAYASLRPETVLETIKEKQAIELKNMIESGEYADLVNNNTQSLSHNHAFDAVDGVSNLKTLIKNRYDRIEEWKGRVLEAAFFFPMEEITTLYRVIFKCVAELYQGNKENNLTEHDLLTTGLVLHYPRCDLTELHSRIRSILYWLQTRSNLKTLGPLINSTALVNIANNSHEPLFKLNTVFKRVEYYWQKKEEKANHMLAKQKKHHEELQLLASVSPGKQDLLMASNHMQPKGLVIPKNDEDHGCSWSQFLIIMWLFCSNQCDLIPSKAFNIDHPKPNAPIEDLNSQYSFQSGDAMSTSSYSVSLMNHNDGGMHHYRHHHVKSSQRNRTPNFNKNRQSPQFSSMSISGGLDANNSLTHPGRSGVFTAGLHMMDQLSSSWTSNLYSPSTSMLLVPQSSSELNPLEPSLFNAAKKTGKITHNWDSSFAEYRFAHFKKRQKQYMDFPKELSLEFAQTLNPRRPLTSMGGSHPPDSGEENGGEVKEGGEGGEHQHDHNHHHGDESTVHSGLHSTDPLDNLHLSKSLPLLSTSGSGKGKLSRAGTASSGIRDIIASSAGLDDHNNKTPHGTLKRPPSRLDQFIAGHQDNNKSLSSSGVMKRQQTLTPKESVHSLASLGSGGGGGGGSGGNSAVVLHRTNTSGSHKRSDSPLKKSFSVKEKGETINKGVSFGAAAAAAVVVVDDEDNLDFDFDDEDGENKDSKKEIKNIDFFRVCALCEQRLPRDSIEIKVFRKHIVKLRSSWDPKLVSKEVRSLDNTISMYNFYYVCYFCAQFFDPDFPEGIAYPTRIAAPTNKKVIILLFFFLQYFLIISYFFI